MATLFVQFTDSSESAVRSYFAGPQDPAEWPNQGVIEQSDIRWIAYFDAIPLALRGSMPPPA